MPMPFVLIPAPASSVAGPSSRRAGARRENRMFPASAIASAIALAAYAAIALTLPLLAPHGRPIVVELPPRDPFEPIAESRFDPPAVTDPRPLPPVPPLDVAEPEPAVVEGRTVVPSADAPPHAAPPAPATSATPKRGGGTDTPAADPARDAGTGQTIAPYYEEAPVPIVEHRPDYPQIAIDARVEGTVLLQVLVGMDGRVEDVRVAQSIPLLDEAAVHAARRWVFHPARVSGRPVRVWVALPVRFSLR